MIGTICDTRQHGTPLTKHGSDTTQKVDLGTMHRVFGRAIDDENFLPQNNKRSSKIWSPRVTRLRVSYGAGGALYFQHPSVRSQVATSIGYLALLLRQRTVQLVTQ